MRNNRKAIREGLIADAWTVVGAVNGTAGATFALVPEIQKTFDVAPINQALAGGVGAVGLVGAVVAFGYAREAERRAEALEQAEQEPVGISRFTFFCEQLADSATRGVLELAVGFMAGAAAVGIAVAEGGHIAMASTPGHAAIALMGTAAAGIGIGSHDVLSGSTN